jgi:hypothetical protein
MVKMSEDQTRRYEVIYCCEYLGFLDGERKKVGCLLHPLQNRGIDLRDVSFYGKDLCHGHFCPGYHYISREEKQSLIAIIDDWYLYGLCVTDVDLIKEYFCVIANRIAETPAPEKFKNGVLKEIALHFFAVAVALEAVLREDRLHLFAEKDVALALGCTRGGDGDQEAGGRKKTHG